MNLIFTAIAIAAIPLCLLWVLKIVLENSDGHYVPSEAAQQAQANAAKTLREVNRINYSQPLNQPTENT